MKIQAITNPITKLMFRADDVKIKKTEPVKEIKIGNGLNQPTKDEFIKEDKPFELPKDVEFEKPVMATKERPYCTFDNKKVELFVNAKEKAIPAVTEMLQNAKTEEEKCEGLYIADRMIASGTKGMELLYKFDAGEYGTLGFYGHTDVIYVYRRDGNKLIVDVGDGKNTNTFLITDGGLILSGGGSYTKYNPNTTY